MSSIELGDEISPEDFARSVFADIGGMEDTADAPSVTDTTSETESDTADAPDGTVDANGRLHDKDGKFAAESTDEPEEDDEELEETEEAEPAEDEASDDDGWVLEVDDEETAERVSKVLEKYDGDPAKALVALAEAQSLIGRKGTEASQASAEAAALRQELAELRSMQEQTLHRISNPVVPITQELVETDPAAAAQQAVLQDNAQALEAAIHVWRNGSEYVDANPQAAQFFLEKLALEAQLAQQNAAVQTTGAASADAEVDIEIAKVLEKHPDLEDHLPAIGKAADENPLLKRAMEMGTPAEKAQALEALTVIAKASHGADTSREAMRRVQVRVKQEADDAKRSARVVSASRGSAAATSQPTRVDQFFEAFDARMGIDISQG